MSGNGDITAFLFVTGNVPRPLMARLIYQPLVSESSYKRTDALKPRPTIYINCSPPAVSQQLSPVVFCVFSSDPLLSVCNSSVSVSLVFANEAEICSRPFSFLSIFYGNYQCWNINTDTGKCLLLLSPCYLTYVRH